MDTANDTGDSDVATRKRTGSPLSGPADYDSAAESSPADEPFAIVMHKRVRKKQLSANKNSQSQANANSQKPASETGKARKSGRTNVAVNNHEACPFCDQNTASADSVQCEVCRHWYHLVCCGVAEGKHEGVAQLVGVLGWACGPCRSSQSELLASTSKAQATLQSELKELKIAFNDLLKHYQRGKGSGQSNTQAMASNTPTDGGPQDEALHLSQPQSGNHAEGGVRQTNNPWGPRQINAQPIANDATQTNLVSIIGKTFRTMNKKKLNVVVSGICETGIKSEDQDICREIFGKFLGIDTTITNCERLGRRDTRTADSTQGGAIDHHEKRPRPLLVTIGSEEEVERILREAKKLRNAVDENIRKFVYVNRDITKEESKFLYEKRQAKREKSLQGPRQQAASAGATANPVGANQSAIEPTSAPSIGGPSIGAPSIGGPSIGGPSIGGPSIGGPSIGDPSTSRAPSTVASGVPSTSSALSTKGAPPSIDIPVSTAGAPSTSTSTSGASTPSLGTKPKP
jgi:hypothetical protein